MEEENQLQVVKELKEPQRVTTKDPKKVEAGKRLAAINRKKREEQTQLKKTTSRVNQYYGIRAVIALGVIGGLGYYIYWSKKGPATNEVTMLVFQQPRPQAIAAQPQTNKFEMD